MLINILYIINMIITKNKGESIMDKKVKVEYLYYDDPLDSFSTDVFSKLFEKIEDAIDYCKTNGVHFNCIQVFNDNTKRWERSILYRN